MSGRDELALEHAWRYFALHSEQRTTVFNFFSASASLALSGLAYVLGTASASRGFGLAAGLGAMLLALVFWKFDQRTVQLIKSSEQVIISLETRVFDDPHRTFAQAEALSVNAAFLPFSGSWTYGRSFRFLFAAVAVLGLAGASLSAYGLLRGSVAASISRPAAGGGTSPRQVGKPADGELVSQERPSSAPPRTSSTERRR